ncbi:MAG: serpin family protein, partial [Clostridia bacterium]|nr:serpin family protein [Clostridia bacterium]
PVLKEMGVRALFVDECDFSPITSSPAQVDQIKHITKLTVDRKGIEGAAVTVEPAAGAAGPGEYKEVYCDYIVDRAFGFVLEKNDIALFSGIINDI